MCALTLKGWTNRPKCFEFLEGQSLHQYYYHKLEFTFIQCAIHPKNVSSFELWIHVRGVHQGPNTST